MNSEGDIRWGAQIGRPSAFGLGHDAKDAGPSMIPSKLPRLDPLEAEAAPVGSPATPTLHGLVDSRPLHRGVTDTLGIMSRSGGVATHEASEPEERASGISNGDGLSAAADGRTGADTPLCAAIDVTKRFGGVEAVKGVSFDVRPGEVHALVGENGAGKTTLVNLFHGLFQPDEGRIEVDGRPVSLRSPRDAEALGIAMIPQELELFPDLSIAENLFVGRRRPRNRLGLYDQSSMRAVANEVFSSLGVRVDVDAPVGHVSFATRQLTSIGRALFIHARVVVMDEPTAALTDREAERLFAVIAGLRDRGVGVVYISHRLDEIGRISSRVTVMRDGRHITTQPTASLPTQDMIRLMVGRPLARLFSRDHTPSATKALELRGLTRAGEFDDVSLSVHRGEVVGLAGLVGAGRSQLAQAVIGLRSLDRGEVHVQGRLSRIKTPGQALALGIAYVPEERRAQGLFLPLSRERNISMSALRLISHLGLVDSGLEKGMSKDLSRQLDIRGGEPEAPVMRLSGGNQQKVVLAKALATDPQILILDEPTRGVDIGAKAEIYRLIDELAREGKAILLISSELEEVLAMADRVLVMCEGRLVASFDHGDATPEKVTAAACGWDEQSTESAGAGAGHER